MTMAKAKVGPIGVLLRGAARRAWCELAVGGFALSKPVLGRAGCRYSTFCSGRFGVKEQHTQCALGAGGVGRTVDWCCEGVERMGGMEVGGIGDGCLGVRS